MMPTLNELGFVSGMSTYREEDPTRESEQTSKNISISIRSATSIPTFARIDPATPWVILNSELNQQLGLCVADENVIKLHTAKGVMTGTLDRYPITLVAEKGSSLEIDATLFVCNDWDRGNFLGYAGFLQRIRFAVDPKSRHFYFGLLNE